MDIFDASLNGNLEEVKRFVDGDNDINIKNTLFSRWTPLLYASAEGHFEVVRFLLECGADVNLSSSNGFTPLMASTYCGSFKVSKLLIKHGAKVNLKTMTDCTALTYASRDSTPNKQTVLLLLHQYSHFLEEGEKKLIQKGKYRCSFGTIAS